LVASGKDKDIMIFGFDGTADVVDAIRAGKITATGMQYPKVMAATAAKFADQYIKGKRDFAQKIPVKVDLVCKETIDKFEAYGKVQEKEKPVAEAVDNIN
jgi:ribose transport system substrate-binding protein